MKSPSVLEGIVREHDDQHCASQKHGFDSWTILVTVILITKQDNTVVDSKMLVCDRKLYLQRTCSCFLNNLHRQRPTF